MRTWARAWLVAGLFLWTGGAAGCDDQSPRADLANEATAHEVEEFDPALAARLPPDVSAREAEEGRELYIVCATCHALDARGTQLGPSLRDNAWITSTGEFQDIQRVIREGVPDPEEFPIPMPAGGGGDFTDDQLRSVAAYVYALSRSGEPVAARQ